LILRVAISFSAARFGDEDQHQPKRNHIMKLQKRLTKFAVLASAFVVVAFLCPVVRGGDDVSFKVHNNTKETITKLLVSEDGKTYGFFDLGDGIEPGDTETIVWDKSAHGQSCHQWFKAVWESGEEGKAVKFDFCEEGLTLEF
jgi:hypothetical protein